jgi:hypothetical protein
MALPSIYYLNAMGKALRWIAPLAGALVSFTLFVTNVFTILVWGALDAIATALGTLDLSGFGHASFAIIQGIGYINAIFPLGEVLIVLTAYYTAWGTVISVRWIKSFVPTIAN